MKKSVEKMSFDSRKEKKVKQKKLIINNLYKIFVFSLKVKKNKMDPPTMSKRHTFVLPPSLLPMI
jgi:hypothetical protein